ncbi:glutathione peroxidase [Heyndrickxia sporothermodurans]|uniref:glutathione peroxidase n=1 Tax=Heyndrickxia sporothermodurans TaxID=46224 RepID=UPI002E20BC45|nr:glutathione peroxidase [Heyndrickxia sporothermodurans]MED3698548.1 glutathione peroxidase [Heyndrickxia sporothermodurans]
MEIYQFSAKLINGEDKKISDYKGKVLLIVNTASKCGFTKQFSQLQDLYQKYEKEGLVILGFPCNQFRNQDPGSNQEIAEFCSLNYNVSFPMFEKVDVNGEHAHPIFQYLTSQAPGMLGTKKIKWNFTKFLIDLQGKVVSRFGSATEPEKIENDIKRLLNY